MRTLAQAKVGPAGLWIMAVVASSPMTVLAGGIPTMYTATGVAGAPLAFLFVAAVLLVVGAAYGAASAHVRHAAPMYALLARGFTPTAGVTGGALALLGYLTIGTSLYGLLGDTMARLTGVGPWWAWAAGAWLVVAALGLMGGLVSVIALGALLSLELGLIVFYILAALGQHRGPITFGSFAPSALVVPGMAGVIAFAMAAFVGVETVPAYAEEVRGGGSALRRAMLAAIGFTGVFYALAAWAMSVRAGGDMDQIADDAAAGPAAVLGRVFGVGYGALGIFLLITSIVAAMTSFHAAGSRYVFAMAREQVLPRVLTVVSRRGDGGIPIAASLVQSALSGTVLAVFVLADADPMKQMFTWLSTVGAVTLLSLLVACAGAAYRFFHQGWGQHDSVWTRRAAPLSGVVAGSLLMVMMLSNLNALLGLAPGSQLWLLVPIIIVVTAVVGLLWAALVQLARPGAFDVTGHVVADPVTSPVQRLSRLTMSADQAGERA